MGLYGNLDTMSVPELFAWVSGGKKSGTLEVERKKIAKRVMFQEGRIVACSSNAPATLLGQFLLSRGKITRQVLSDAMRRHAQSGAHLGATLVEMGAITPADQDAFVAHKVEETLDGLFDWSEAVFRFYTDALPDPNALEVDLAITEILERGLRRRAERKRSSEAITDPAMVLRRTGGSVPSELEGHLAARRIYDLIDGKKTVAEILLHSHAPEFLVTKFLTVLIKARVVEVGQDPVEPDAPAAMAENPETAAASHPAEPLSVDEPVEGEPVEDIAQSVELVFESSADEAPDISSLELDPGHSQIEVEGPDLDLQVMEPEIESLMAAAARVEDEIAFEVPPDSPERGEQTETAPPAPEDGRDLQDEINVALQLMSSGQPEAALELLNAMAAAHPGDVSLAQLVGNAERDYRQQVLAGELQPSMIPTRTQVADPDQESKVTPDESFLLEHIDGVTDIQALLWVTPMRDVEVLKTLSRLLRKGWIEVREAA
jgi:hypothetical protein